MFFLNATATIVKRPLHFSVYKEFLAPPLKKLSKFMVFKLFLESLLIISKDNFCHCADEAEIQTPIGRL